MPSTKKDSKSKAFNKEVLIDSNFFKFYEKSQTSAKYQAKLEIIGFDKPINVDTDDFSKYIRK